MFTCIPGHFLYIHKLNLKCLHDSAISYVQEGSPLYRCTDCILKKFDLCEKCFKDGEGEKHLQQFGPEHRLVKETEWVLHA